MAADEGHLEAVEYLISVGADVMAEDRWHSTPLRGAIKYFHTDVVSALENAGAHLKAVKDIQQGSKEWIEEREHLNDVFEEIAACGATEADGSASRNAFDQYLEKQGFFVRSHPTLEKENKKPNKPNSPLLQMN